MRIRLRSLLAIVAVAALASHGVVLHGRLQRRWAYFQQQANHHESECEGRNMQMLGILNSGNGSKRKHEYVLSVMTYYKSRCDDPVELHNLERMFAPESTFFRQPGDALTPELFHAFMEDDKYIRAAPDTWHFGKPARALREQYHRLRREAAEHERLRREYKRRWW